MRSSSSKIPPRVLGRKHFFKRFTLQLIRRWRSATERVTSSCLVVRCHVVEHVAAFVQFAKAPKTIFLGTLATILSMAALLRVVGLGSALNGLTAEEATYAVQSRMLVHTGKDLTGRWLPLFPSEDFSSLWHLPNMVCQPIFFYLNIPLNLLLGDNTTAVRLPSVLWGMVSLASTTVLSWMLFWHATLSVRRIVAASTALLLCISPCHHFMSRLAMPEITSSVFLTIGMTFLLNGVVRIASKRSTAEEMYKEGQACFYCGTLLLALTAYTHSGMTLFSLLIFSAFFTLFCSQSSRSVLQCSLLMLLLLLPAMFQLFSASSASHTTELNGSSVSSESANQHVGLFTRLWLSQLQLLCGFWSLNEEWLLNLSAETPLLIVGLAWLTWQSFSQTSENRCNVCIARLLLVWFLTWPLANRDSVVRGWAAEPIVHLVAGYGIGRCTQWLMDRKDSRDKAAASKSKGLVLSTIPTAELICLLVFSLLGCWLIYSSAMYYRHVYSSPELFPNGAMVTNGGVTHRPFADLRDSGFFNKSRVLLTEDVRGSFPFILYAENVLVSMDELNAGRTRDLNSALQSVGMPYKIVFTDIAHTYTINESDLLLINSEGLQRYPHHLASRLKLLHAWSVDLFAFELARDDECTDCDDDI